MLNTFTQSWFDQPQVKCKAANGKSKLFLELLSIASGWHSNRPEAQGKQIAHMPYTFVFFTHLRWKSVTTSETPVTITFSTPQFYSFSEYTLWYLSAPVVTMLFIHHTCSLQEGQETRTLQNVLLQQKFTIILEKPRS